MRKEKNCIEHLFYGGLFDVFHVVGIMATIGNRCKGLEEVCDLVIAQDLAGLKEKNILNKHAPQSSNIQVGHWQRNEFSQTMKPSKRSVMEKKNHCLNDHLTICLLT